ncbi:MAG: hypothetical protein Q7W45_01755 [Bacteroidota bacterium]|nr:hypothetical protein [Bacteroidota bacterium]MDP3146463.1 hypothetical protein [Bacteroidota bacterium]
MDSISFTLDANKEIWEFLDKTVDHVLVHNFHADNSVKWWTSTIKISPQITLDNVQVRSMQFDIQTNVVGLKQILDIESNFLDIYQFNKPIADSLTIDALPKDNAINILKKNGLQHIICVEFELITVKSFSSDFINSIRDNPLFVDRIRINKSADT